MPRFHIVPVSGAAAAFGWSIEKVIPGEAPVPIEFFGSRTEIENEVIRLNAGGEIRRKKVSPAKRSKALKRIPTNF